METIYEYLDSSGYRLEVRQSPHPGVTVLLAGAMGETSLHLPPAERAALASALSAEPDPADIQALGDLIAASAGTYRGWNVNDMAPGLAADLLREGVRPPQRDGGKE